MEYTLGGQSGPGDVVPYSLFYQENGQIPTGPSFGNLTIPLHLGDGWNVVSVVTLETIQHLIPKHV